MGVYYKVACDELNECVDPGEINDLGCKRAAVAHPQHPLGPVVMFALLHRWPSARIVDDSGGDPGYFDYKDVTEAVIAAYNQYYGTNLSFTPDRD